MPRCLVWLMLMFLAIDAFVHQKAVSGCVRCNLFILLNASQPCAALLHVEGNMVDQFTKCLILLSMLLEL
jgi:hypothetical protein